MDDELLFDDAADHVAAQVTAKNPAFTDKIKLALYGLYKQATAGTCSTSKPGIFDLSGRAKWDAWHKLGPMPCEEAKRRYVQSVTEVDPGWQASGSGEAGPAKKRGMGPVFSAMANEEDGAAAALNDSPDCAIHELAGRGDCAGVSRLLGSGVAVDQRDDVGCTALHFAADRGCLNVLTLLLDAGADLHARDEDGQTPLHYAALCGHQEASKLLLSRGADVNAVDNAGKTAQQCGPAGWSIWE